MRFEQIYSAWHHGGEPAALWTTRSGQSVISVLRHNAPVLQLEYDGAAVGRLGVHDLRDAETDIVAGRNLSLNGHGGGKSKRRKNRRAENTEAYLHYVRLLSPQTGSLYLAEYRPSQARNIPQTRDREGGPW
jgi:hypothetical protein